MNDFLQTLRSGHPDKQRAPMTRRSYDEAFSGTVPGYQYVNRSAPTFQPPNRIPPPADDASRLRDAVENLTSHMATLAIKQKNLIDVQEKTADMLERQVLAIEKILDHLGMFSE